MPDPLWKPFISSFIKTFLKEYLIPILHKKTFLSWFNEKSVEWTCSTILDLYLYSFSLSTIGVTQIPHIVLFALNYAGLKPNESILYGIETAILGYMTGGQSLKNSFFAIPGAGAGTFMARKVITFIRNTFENELKQDEDLEALKLKQS